MKEIIAKKEKNEMIGIFRKDILKKIKKQHSFDNKLEKCRKIGEISKNAIFAIFGPQKSDSREFRIFILTLKHYTFDR